MPSSTCQKCAIFIHLSVSYAVLYKHHVLVYEMHITRIHMHTYANKGRKKRKKWLSQFKETKRNQPPTGKVMQCLIYLIWEQVIQPWLMQWVGFSFLKQPYQKLHHMVVEKIIGLHKAEVNYHLEEKKCGWMKTLENCHQRSLKC